MFVVSCVRWAPACRPPGTLPEGNSRIIDPQRSNVTQSVVAATAAVSVRRIVDPSDTDAFVASARCLIGDADGRRRQGANARAYAERTFDVEAITNRFVGFIDGVLAGRR